MLRLRTLGGLSVERPDGPAPPANATSARRRLALLAVLAATDAPAVPRDKLLALFWPESDDERARHALDQTLYALRKAFDSDTLILGREELSLDRDAITSDVRDFKDAIAREDPASAMALYAGPFLDGVFISGSAEFERWVDGERHRLAVDASAAIATLASQCAERGDHRTAAAWWNRRVQMDGTDFKAVLGLMSELAASGDVQAALRHADIYEALMRADGDDAPNSAVAGLAERLRGTPVVVEMPEVPAHRIASPDSAGPAVPFTEVPRTRRRLLGVGTAAVLTVLALPTAWIMANRRAADDRPWVVAADFENRTPDSVFNRSLDAALIFGLEQSSFVNVVPRPRIQQTLMRMTGGGSADAGAAPRATPPLTETVAREVAERDGVPLVVVPVIDRVDSSYVITARLVEVSSGNDLGAERATAKRQSDVIDALDDVVRSLRRRIGESSSRVGKHDRRLPQATTRSLEALRKFADASIAAGRNQRSAATELLEQAVAIDSDFALAHASLGVRYYFDNDRPRGDVHFTRALSLLDRLTDRERLIVRATAEDWRGDRARAIVLWRALLEEYPDDPGAWGQIAYDDMRLNRRTEAVDAYRKQLLRDSSNTFTLINLATALREGPQNDEAIRTYRRAFALQPSLLMVPNINNEYGVALIYAGRFPEARAAFESLLRGGSDEQARGRRSIAMLLMLQGKYGEAIDQLREAVTLSQTPKHELTEARNRLFLAAVESEKGWRDSASAELRDIHLLFRHAYLEPAFLMYFGKALVRDGQTKLAAEVFDSLRARAKPGSPVDQANLGVLAADIALARGLTDSAVHLIQRAVVVDSTALAVESLARALAAAGNARGAAQRYEAMATTQPRSFGFEAEIYAVTAWLGAGEAYERFGDVDHARAAYQRQLALWSHGDSDLVPFRAASAGIARLGAASATATQR